MAIVPARGDVDYRRRLSWILIVVSSALMLGRLATVRSTGGATPMLSANDRSRWTTIRSLVDHGTYELDKVIFKSPGERDPAWYTIDLVQHRGADGRQHYYSSKPTLLTTLLAIPYWLIHLSSGIAIANKPFYVMRLTLFVVHVLPTIGLLVLLARFIDRFGNSDWGQQFAVASAAFATPLTTFSVTLNNHTPAALCVFVATCSVMAIWRAAAPGNWLFFVSGIFAVMAVVCELPALSFLVLVAALLFWKSPWRTFAAFFPPVLVVLVGTLVTNYVAHGTWSTPYAHRRDGRLLATLPQGASDALRLGVIDPQLREPLSQAGITLAPDSTVQARNVKFGGYEIWDPSTEQRYAVQTNGSGVRIHEWDNWYDYDGSYWSGRAKGVDLGEPSRWVYAFHVLVGHHGLLSLTPIWLLSLWGMLQWMRQKDAVLWGLGVGTALLTIVCLTFYIVLRPLEDRNYGGVSCYFRWAIWLIPLWLVCMLPALDAIAERPWLRRMTLGLLLLSAFSAAYGNHNPWSHPWLFDYWTNLGWIKY